MTAFFISDYLSCMDIEKLYTVEYKPNGRTLEEGFDCYGFCIYACKQDGKKLLDITYDDIKIDEDRKADYLPIINVYEINAGDARKGDLIQCTYQSNLHIGYIYDKRKTIAHMTYNGFRLSPLIVFKNVKYYRVKD